MRILLVAYFYPPCTDTGASRPAALAKYLKRLGHEVTVLTTSAYGSLPDDEAEGIHRSRDLQTWRARLAGRGTSPSLYDSDTYSLKPHPLSKVIVPEPLALAWAPFARRKALKLRRRIDFDCVITTSPPESAHAIGRALARRGVPWIADIRDAWNFEPLKPRFPTSVQRRLDARLERRWLGAADRVVCVSRPAAADLERRLGIDAEVVHNGADPELMPGGERKRETAAELLDPERVSLVYTGRFGSYGRDPAALVRAIEALAERSPELAARFELVIAGPLTPEERLMLESAEVAPARIVLAGSLDRERALGLQLAADGLLLLANSDRSQLANFKLYEYLAAGRPILALAAGTEAGRIVAETGGEQVAADDPEAIEKALGHLIAGELRAPDPESGRYYSYPAVAARMAAVVAAAAGQSQEIKQ